MYKDVELNAASEIAYYDLTDRFDSSTSPKPVPLTELLSDGDGNLGAEGQSRLDNLEILGVSKEEIATWKVVDIYDTNDATGFYAVIIETSPGNAIVAFRGSEGFDSLDNLVNDWFHGDLELLNSFQTTQHREVLKFMEAKKDILDKYTIASTGHSLGGNLSDYFTITSGRYGLDDNIVQSVSNDGPGFSNEFIASHWAEIQKMKDKMTHYSWSLVGELLQPLPIPEENRKFIDVRDASFYEYDSSTGKVKLNDSGYNSITRHNRYFVKYDENGNFVKGEQDPASALASVVSKSIDHMPVWLGERILIVTETLIISAMWLKGALVDKDGNLTPLGWGLMIAGVAEIAMHAWMIPVAIVSVVPTVLAVIAVLGVIILYEGVYEFAVFLAHVACDIAQAIYNWAKDVYHAIKQAVINIIEGIVDWYKKNFDAGYKYSQNHTRIVIDTGKMYSYAEQLRAVSRRLNTLNQRIDALLWKIGPAANIIGLQSVYYDVAKLNRCCSYLSDTASEFDSTENDIAGKI